MRISRRYLLIAACVGMVMVLGAPTAAMAVTQSPEWTVTAWSAPTNFAPQPGTKGLYRIYVQNTGGAPSDGSAVTITDALPAGLKTSGEPVQGLDFDTGTAVSCTGLSCTYSGVVGIDQILEVNIPVEVAAGAKEDTEANVVTVSGGGTPEVSRETPTTINSTPSPFGVAPGSTAMALSTDQAGAHPDLTTVLAYNSDSEGLVAGNVRENAGILPPGFAGDLADTPRCPITTFSEEGQNFGFSCPMSSVVGTVVVYLTLSSYRYAARLPLVNLATNPGEIARFGFTFIGLGIEGSVSLVAPTYAVRVTFEKIPDISGTFDGIALTVWGAPADHSHDLMRGYSVNGQGPGEYDTESGRLSPTEAPNGLSVSIPPIPYLTSPTQCTGEPLHGTIEVNSWEEPEHELYSPADIGPMTDCNLLEFAPGISVAPDTTRADTPAGLTFGVKMNQEGLINERAASEADVQNTTVTLPAGMAINPGQANGLGACQESQEELDKEAPPRCPSNSKVGEVEIETPLLRDKISGNVYVLQSNPPDLKLMVAPEDPTGRDLRQVRRRRASQRNRRSAGHDLPKDAAAAVQQAQILLLAAARRPRSPPQRSAASTGRRAISRRGARRSWRTRSHRAASRSKAARNGAPCPPTPLPFNPAMDAGATTDQAGGYTSFSLLLTRADDQQRIATLQFKTPEGLLGMIAKVPLCGEPQASKGDMLGRLADRPHRRGGRTRPLSADRARTG